MEGGRSAEIQPSLGGSKPAFEQPTLLASADIIVVLISPDLFADPGSQSLVTVALDRQEREPQRVTIVPVLVRAMLWQGSRLSRFQPLPENGKPVATWPDQDSAWHHVVSKLTDFIRKLRSAAGG